MRRPAETRPIHPRRNNLRNRSRKSSRRQLRPSSTRSRRRTRRKPQAAPAQAQPAPPPQKPGAPASTGIPTLRVSVNLVDLFFVVHDKAGKLVPDLTQADCSVSEDNVLQKLKSFTAQTDLPLSIGILLDTSLSQQRVLPAEQQAASAFLRRILRPTDESFLISFDVTVDLLADWTRNPDDLKRALDAAQINSSSGNFANGTLPSITQPKGTLLYDAVYLASNDKLRQESGRKAMVLLTDGQDEGSDEKLQSAIEAAQKADAVVYVILISDPGIYGTLDFSSDGAMRKLVEATGGEVFPIGKNGKKLSAAFDAIESQLRTNTRPPTLRRTPPRTALSAYSRRLPAERPGAQSSVPPRLLCRRSLRIGLLCPISKISHPPCMPVTLAQADVAIQAFLWLECGCVRLETFPDGEAVRVSQAVFGVFHHFELAHQLRRYNYLDTVYSTYPWRTAAAGAPAARIRPDLSMDSWRPGGTGAIRSLSFSLDRRPGLVERARLRQMDDAADRSIENKA